MVCVSLKEEKQAHAKTRARLAETQDKLELVLGEVDILRKQIQREKAQFEQTLVVSGFCCCCCCCSCCFVVFFVLCCRSSWIAYSYQPTAARVHHSESREVYTS